MPLTYQAVFLNCSVHSLDPSILVINSQQFDMRIYIDKIIQIISDVQIRSRVGMSAHKNSIARLLEQNFDSLGQCKCFTGSIRSDHQDRWQWDLFKNIQKLKEEKLFLYLFKKKSFTHSGPEYLKKSRPKKLVKSKKSISRKIFFDQIPFFAISKMAKKQFLNWEKLF